MRIPRRCGLLSFILLPLLGFFVAPPASAKIDYRISLADRANHRFAVTMDIHNPVTNTQIAIPAWNALYQIRDFSVRVRDVHLDPTYPIRKVDKQTWSIGDPMNPLAGNVPDDFVVHYTVEWNDPGPFDSQLDARHAFLNLAEVLMYVPNRRPEAVEVAFDDVPAGWKVAAELPAGSEPNSFSAPSYDVLVDAPVEAGTFRESSFDVDSVHYRVILDSTVSGSGALDANLRKIVSYESTLMQGTPFREYTFFFHIGAYPDVGGGGMEHSNCTAIAAPTVDSATATAAHEFFHAWNVKRVRPKSLEYIDFSREQYTRSLWFAEGVTSAYAAFTLERTGLWSKDLFLMDLGEQISDLQSRSARSWQSVEESSLDAWLEKYDSYRAPDRSISYYNKGQILGDLLDLSIRQATKNHKSLDDVLRLLNDEYAQKGKFYDESAGILSAVNDVAGMSFADFFHRYVSGTDEIPYAQFLSYAGLDLKEESQVTSDLGFWPGQARGAKIPTVATIEAGSPAEAADLRVGDDIIRLNNEPFPHQFRNWLRNQPPNATVTLRVRRDGKELDISYRMASVETDHFSVSEDPHPTDLQRRIRDGFFRGTTD
ncbi:MAG TPA: PDZ domain-containing protein [Candidatus Acidoferrum sp.]|nr:PDZ domain-containing protein [Candidatus Acidoferrum sp.]